MNSLTRIMSYDKTKIKNQENCNCEECISVENVELKNQTVEYPKLSKEEIEQIISERYLDKDEKAKTFIRKALRKYGDKYDYSNVLYIRSDKKVEIICRIKNHKPCSITPNHHLHGQECKMCTIERISNLYKSNTEEFIKKARKIHGDKYDYSLVDYNGTHVEVQIICSKHGPFPQTPANHLIGHGCRECANEKLAEIKTLTLEEFIEKANKIHHNKYDYSLVDYKNYQEEVQIICPRHGAFPQKPNSHLQGSGCSKCKIESQTLSKEEFIKRANEIHGDGIYDYTHVDYQGYDENVQIICSKHGPFSQTPANHLNGKGCSKCAWEKLANERKMTLEEFIEEANKIHGEGTYDYSKVDYKNYKTEVIIICPKHGDFPQTPASHLKGCGCRKCNKNIGENAIRNFLTKNNIEFEEQKKFEGCKYKRQLRFDFYIPKYNLCIESDGIPHFEKVNWNGKMTNEEMEKLLKSNQFRDKIKNDYCKKNGIILLRVNNLKAVEELSKYFQYYKINFNL